MTEGQIREDLGYLKRAVEDLTNHLHLHMDDEEKNLHSLNRKIYGLYILVFSLFVQDTVDWSSVFSLLSRLY